MNGSSLAVIDYGAGNLRSVQNALAALGFDHVVTSDPEVVRRASTLIVPGDGEASSAMATAILWHPGRSTSRPVRSSRPLATSPSAATGT